MANDPVAIVREFYRRMNTNDYTHAAALFSDDYVLDWPQSNERIRGRARFVAVNEEYPTRGRWRFTIHRVVANQTEAVSDVTVADDATTTRAITFTTTESGKIVRQTEYWVDEYHAPENRAHLVEPIEPGGGSDAGPRGARRTSGWGRGPDRGHHQDAAGRR